MKIEGLPETEEGWRQLVAKKDSRIKELEKGVEGLAKWCEGRNNIQLDGNEFAPSFIKRIKDLIPKR